MLRYVSKPLLEDFVVFEMDGFERIGSFELFELVSSRFRMYFGSMFNSLRFKSKSELAQEMGISRETLRKKLKEVVGLETGRRQLLYPREVKRIYQTFSEE